MTRDRLDELMDEAYGMSHSPAQVAILEEAVRLADSLQETDYGIEARLELIDAATFSGADDKALVAFAWVLARFDDDPYSVDLTDLLWKYKWIIGSISSFPGVSREKLIEMEDDMERRYRAGGFSLRPVYDSRAANAQNVGDKDRCIVEYAKWMAAPRDEMADCLACEQNSQIRFLTFFGEWEQAVEAAGPILAGDMYCSCVPESTYARILFPLMKLERFDEARRLHKKGYRLISGNPDYLNEAAEHLLFMVRDNDFPRGIRCVERHAGGVEVTAVADNRMHFYCAAAALFEKLTLKRTEVKLRLPPDHPIRLDSGVYDPRALADWFQQQCDELAGRFNERNGNTCESERMADWREMALA